MQTTPSSGWLTQQPINQYASHCHTWVSKQAGKAVWSNPQIGTRSTQRYDNRRWIFQSLCMNSLGQLPNDNHTHIPWWIWFLLVNTIQHEQTVAIDRQMWFQNGMYAGQNMFTVSADDLLANTQVTCIGITSFTKWPNPYLKQFIYTISIMWHWDQCCWVTM